MEPTTLNYRQRRAEKRALRKARPKLGERRLPEAMGIEDPLARATKNKAINAARALLVAVGAVVMHVVVIVLISVAGLLTKASAVESGDKIEVAINEVKNEPPPPPPKVEEPPPPEEKVEEKPKKKERAPPPVDPVDIPKQEPPKEEKPKEVRRIVGLNLESTVGGGEGPSFAVGNTRMGETEKTAEKPTEAQPLAKVEEKPAEEVNKAATRIPTGKAKVVAPQRKKAIQPEYPERARQDGIEGDVVVRVVIDASGKPTSVSIVKPADDEELNAAAKKAAMKEIFSPATRDGVAIEYALTYTYYFRLNG
jgi:protein TonB